MTELSAASLKVLNPLPGDAWSDAFLAQVAGHGPVVLRTLKPAAAADPTRVERFVAGAHALSKLRHGAVVSVLGAGTTAEGKAYVITEHVEGDSLAGRPSLPLRQLVEIGLPLADALGAAHSLGLVHGALSSARVWLTAQGARLDFALAPLLREDSADAAGDLRTLVAMLSAHSAPEAGSPLLDGSLRRALHGLPDARALKDRLASLRGVDSVTGDVASTAVVNPEHGDDPSLVGQTLGSYVIEKVIGEGAMGRVYLARHSRIHRHAAIKVMRAEHARSRELVQRFIQEATAVNAIQNDHIVEVYDFGENLLPDGGSRVFCVMELLEGTALSDEMWRAPLSIERSVRIAQQVTRALGSAHAVGVLHRDIKPDNIFLMQKDGADFVKLLDFGVAKLLKQIGDLPRSATTQGVVIGTPEYMAPEQALGLPTDVRADLYSVGLVLYEMLVGAPPFQAETFGNLVVEITSKVVPPLPLRTRKGELIPRSLADVVLKCLAKKPDERWSSAEELAGALEPFTGRADAVHLRPTEADAQAIAAMRPKGGRVLLAAAILLVLSVMGVWSVSRPGEATALPQPAAAAPAPVAVEVESNPSGARVVRTDTGELLGVTPLQAKLQRREGPVTLRFELEGRQPLERTLSLHRDSALSVDLAAVPVPPSPTVVEKPVAPEPKPARPKSLKRKPAPPAEGLAGPDEK